MGNDYSEVQAPRIGTGTNNVLSRRSQAKQFQLPAWFRRPTATGMRPILGTCPRRSMARVTCLAGCYPANSSKVASDADGFCLSCWLNSCGRRGFGPSLRLHVCLSCWWSFRTPSTEGAQAGPDGPDDPSAHVDGWPVSLGVQPTIACTPCLKQ